MSRRKAFALGTVLLAATIAGCGATADERAAKRVVEDWVHAVAAHDSASACATLSAKLRANIERHLLGEGVSGSCRTWAARYVSPRHPAARRGADVQLAGITGELAAVLVSAPGTEISTVSLVKEDGVWRIDDY